MKLNEFKEMMNTDARQRAEAQEKTIKELHKLLAEKDQRIEILEARLDMRTKGAHREGGFAGAAR